jgi:two-component system, NtrC family, C4-dicarboxylate transport sensor histidine kinase DctB
MLPARRIVASVMLVAVGALLTEGAGRLAERRAVAAVVEEGRAAWPLASAALLAEIDRQRTVPVVLAQEGSIRASLRLPLAGNLSAVNEKLRLLAEQTQAQVIYLLNRDGRAVAASNYREPDSFVGSDYRFRRYYAQAIANGSAQQYALGTVSGRPGVYLSQRVDEGDTPLGVVVAKVELDNVEAAWGRTARPTFVTDARGVVLATSVPAWRFHTVAPLSAPEADAARDDLQFPDADLSPLPGAERLADGTWRLRAVAEAGRFAETVAPLDRGPESWLHILSPLDGARRAAGIPARLVTALTLLLLALAAFLLARRRRREQEKRDALARTAQALEAAVAARTAELTRANGQLEREMRERAEAQDRIIRLRDDLAQANRLATLGQITAGVAHEINQPLAAIRAYAENARRFLERAQTETARENLGHIVGLTERVGSITDTLRSIARRPAGGRLRVELREAVDGAMLMLSTRLAEQRIEVVPPDAAGSFAVEADRLRLEQVLVNLLRNAMDALRGHPAPRIAITLGRGDGRVRLGVSDNGPGLSPEQMDRLFTPFSTTKPDGLGLGLVISQDIVSEFGGQLSAGPAPGGGAAFLIELPEAGRP